MNRTRDDDLARPKRDEDLQRDPGIGQSKGAFTTGEHPQTIKGENTVEGDMDNDSTATDGVPERQRERTNS